MTQTQLDPQLTNALVSLAIIVLGGLGTLVTALIIWIARKLDTNTKLTKEGTTASKEAKEASNGRLIEVLAKLETQRTITAGLFAQLRAQQDELAFYLAQHPDMQAAFEDRRRRD